MAEGDAAKKAAADNKGCGLGCLGVVLLVALFTVLGSDGKDAEDDPEVQGYGAQSACEDWVKEKLKAPSTAEFDDQTISGSGPWTITGAVDAENSFGAKIRGRWTCTVRLDGEFFRGNATLSQ